MDPVEPASLLVFIGKIGLKWILRNDKENPARWPGSFTLAADDQAKRYLATAKAKPVVPIMVAAIHFVCAPISLCKSSLVA